MAMQLSTQARITNNLTGESRIVWLDVATWKNHGRLIGASYWGISPQSVWIELL